MGGREVLINSELEGFSEKKDLGTIVGVLVKTNAQGAAAICA